MISDIFNESSLSFMYDDDDISGNENVASNREDGESLMLTHEEMTSLATELKNPNELFEAFLLDDICRLSDEEKAQFIQSEACELLINEGMLAKRNIMKLTKESDLDRRMKVASLQMAKEKGDRLYNLAIKYRALSKQHVAAIVKKYHMQAERLAKIGQKAYIRKNPISMKITSTPEKIDKGRLFDVDRSSGKSFASKDDDD